MSLPFVAPPQPCRLLRRRLGLPERRLQPLVRLLEHRLDAHFEGVGPLLGDHALSDEVRGELLADGRMRGDSRGHQRLGVGGLVLLVVAEAAVADEVDDDVVPEAAAEREREPNRRDRRLGVVGVDVDDRDVEAFRQVTRITGRAALGGIGGEADLVVRDQVERAAGRVAGETLDVQRLGDHALAGKRRVAVDQDRKRNAGVVDAGARRAVGLLGTRAALDHGVDRLEMARVGAERDRDLTRRRLPDPFGAEVVLDVAGAALGVGDDRLDRALALELAEDRLVGLPDRVGEDAQPAAVRHPHHDLVGARLGGKTDRLVEHGDHHVEAFDRELLLPQEGTTEVALEALDLGEPLEQLLLFVGAERPAVLARFDRLAEPHPAFVVGDVLDLVRDRPAVGLAQDRQRVGERLRRHRQTEQ